MLHTRQLLRKCNYKDGPMHSSLNKTPKACLMYIHNIPVPTNISQRCSEPKLSRAVIQEKLVNSVTRVILWFLL